MDQERNRGGSKVLLQSIKLENFRQFQNEYIEFSDGKKDGKNVTIIIGENGSGKTTFAQAFFWCLYGKTEFSDKSLLNKIVEQEMVPGQEEKVKVVLKLHHGYIDYTLTRQQTYRKDYSNRLKIDNSILDIEKKDEDGNYSFVKRGKCESEIKNILPEELSKYFFFDGERIEKMSEDISTGKKSTDFAEAVKGLLGLNGMSSALEHLNPHKKNSVIGSYENEYNVQNNEKIKEYTSIIDKDTSRLEEINKNLEGISNNLALAKNRLKEKSAEIKEYEEGEKLQNRKEQLEKQISNAARTRSIAYEEMCKDFNECMNSFFSISLIEQALKMLHNKDFTGKDIPSINAKTIEYLLEQKVCICGTHLDEGSVPYNKVKQLEEFLPPKSLSNIVGDFYEESKFRKKWNQDLVGRLGNKMAIISQQNDSIDEFQTELSDIEGKLSGENVSNKVRSIQNEITFCEKTIKENEKDKDALNKEMGAKESEIKRCRTERSSLALLDDRNKKIEIYKKYAERIYEELLEVYTSSEAKIRQRLQDTINEIFKQIYEGGLSLTIDDKYHISVYANDYIGDVETSSAQSIAVIFAFITAIIKLARENRNSSDENDQLLSSEPYPLVMDAPLSVFDKKRIKTVCEALPQTAEQVVIFIKDTDGELAEKYMENKIGSRHQFIKENEFKTILL